MSVDHSAWAPVAAFLDQEIGYAIAPGKYYLLDANLRRLLREPHPQPAQLAQAASRDPRLRQELIDAATINESFFFRDQNLWSALSQRVLPELAQAVGFCRELHVLICACARGQEVWTLAMCLAEQPELAGQIRCHITAADIDQTALAYAQAGVYSELEVSRGLDPARRQRWFQTSGRSWSVNPELRREVRFQPLNLSRPFSFPRRFDLVFCRNVLIYFDPGRKPAVLENLARVTNNHGYLALGGAESAIGLAASWNPRNLGGYTFSEKRY